MSSDVNEDGEDYGRYRGFDLDDDVEIEGVNSDDATTTTLNDRSHNGISSDIGSSAPFMQQRLLNQARAITTLQEKHKAELAKASRQTSREEVDLLRKTISEQAETITNLKQDLEKYKASNTDEANETKKRKRDDLGDVMNIAMVADSFEKDEKIKELRDEVSKLKLELKKSRETQCKPSVADKKTEVKSRILPETPVPNLQTLLDKMDTKMEEQMTQIKKLINSSIDEKIGKQIPQSATLTYASKAATGTRNNESNEL